LIVLNANISSKIKWFLGYAIAGIVFAFATTFSINIITSTLGLEFGSSVQGIVSAMFSGNIMATVAVALTTILFGVFIWVFSYLAGMFKSKIDGNKNPLNLKKRPHLIGFLVLGIIGVGIFGLIDEVLAGVGTSTNLDSFMGAVSNMNVMGIVLQLVAYSVLGFVVIWLGARIQAIEGALPEVTKKV
jgi:hypothetical protein